VDQGDSVTGTARDCNGTYHIVDGVSVAVAMAVAVSDVDRFRGSHNWAEEVGE
jgi:hypothetical protein